MDKIFSLIKAEEKRQRETLMMIPSENYTYPEVRRAVGSVLMHKYAEGQPGKRYYQGNKIVDEIEILAKARALDAFGLSDKKWSANVQAHSGCPANLAVYNALLNPGDKILSMYLPDGGHLSHGWHLPASAGKPGKKITFVSKIWKVDFYKVNPATRVFNYGVIEKQAISFKPRMIISGGTAYPRQIDHKRLSQIAKKVGAYYLADISHEAGLIAGGANKSPFSYADVVTMTTHKTLRGPRGAIIICRKDLKLAIDASIFPGLQGGPHIHTIAGIAVALGKTKGNGFKKYALQVVKNAKALSRKLSEYHFDVVSGGTEKHMILIDLRSKKLNGTEVAEALEKSGIIVNKNTVPGETASPFSPSGIRLGTPAITARGMKEPQMILIADWIKEIVDSLSQSLSKREKTQKSIYFDVKKLCKKFPVP